VKKHPTVVELSLLVPLALVAVLVYGCASFMSPELSEPRATAPTISDPLPIHELRWYSSLQILRTLCVAPEY
jgi:hypothetical protein